MGLIRKKNSQPTHAELLLEKIFDGDAEPIEQGERVEQLEPAEHVHQSPQQLEQQPRPQLQPEAPTEGWMQTGEAEVPFFVDDAGRMWVGAFLDGGGERWWRRKSGDKGAR